MAADDIYSYFLSEDSEGNQTYEFSTLSGRYVVSFRPSEYAYKVDDYPLLRDSGWAIEINSFSSGVGDKVKGDSRICLTIGDIIHSFFSDNSEDLPVLLYYCDPNDERQRARSRMFERWYQMAPRKDEILKREAEVEIEGANDDESISQYLGYITTADNPNIALLDIEFAAFAEEISNEGK